MVIKYSKYPKNIPNGHQIYQHFPIWGPEKFSKIGIVGLKTNHLATLVHSITKKFQLTYFLAKTRADQSGLVICKKCGCLDRERIVLIHLYLDLLGIFSTTYVLCKIYNSPFLLLVNNLCNVFLKVCVHIHTCILINEYCTYRLRCNWHAFKFV
jgi:hypothetical protein